MSISMPNGPSGTIDSKPTNGPDNSSGDDETRSYNHPGLLSHAMFIVYDQGARKHKPVHLGEVLEARFSS